jgi:hypothetical protein
MVGCYNQVGPPVLAISDAESHLPLIEITYSRFESLDH